jgi:hypothetical protein
MLRRTFVTSVAMGAGAAVLAGSVHADDDNITKRLVNSPNAKSWSIGGVSDARKVKDAGVQGEVAILVNVPGPGDAWAIGAGNLLTRPITSGDKLVAAVWLKVETDSGEPARIHGLIQLADAPWTPIAEKDFQVGPQWKLYTLEVEAKQDYARDKLNFSLHLKTGKQRVYIGPGFVLNMSRTY